MNKKELMEFLEKNVIMDVGDKVYDVQNGYKTKITDIIVYIRSDGKTIEYILESDFQAHNIMYLIKLTPENLEIVEKYLETKEKIKQLTQIN